MSFQRMSRWERGNIPEIGSENSRLIVQIMMLSSNTETLQRKKGEI